MNISKLNVRIVFAKQSVTVDDIGNHINDWVTCYECWATPGNEGGGKSAEAGTTNDDTDISFTVRDCRTIREVEITTHRIYFDGESYTIKNIDHYGYKGEMVKFECQKIRR